MSDSQDRVRFGPYRLVRELSPCRLGRRWLALRESDQSSHAIYRFDACHDRVERRRFSQAMQSLGGLRHPHLLPVEMRSFEPGCEPWAVTPYTGNHDSIVTLEHVARAKGETLSAFETERAMLQLLEAVEHAHSRGVYHGPIRGEDVLVDRHGSVLLEMYGVGRTLAGLGRGNSELAGDEVRSLVELAYRLTTGLPADEPRIPAWRLLKRAPRGFDDWLEEGLDPGAGFRSASEAISKLPCRRPEEESSRVRTVLGRIRVWAR